MGNSMISIFQNGKKFPLSKNILNRSLKKTGLFQVQINEVINRIMAELSRLQIEEIDSDHLLEMICTILHQNRFFHEERYYRICGTISELKQPVIVFINGAPGTDTHSVAIDVARHLGINHLFNSDVVRDLMRYILPGDIVPDLHIPCFNDTGNMSNGYHNKISGFKRQSSLICEGIRAYIKQNLNEGINAVIYGEYLIPGLLNMHFENNEAFVFHYVLQVNNEEKHLQQLHTEGRDVYYSKHFEEVREMQEYIKDMARNNGVMIIDNYDLDNTIKTILDDITIELETFAIMNIS